jgi:hypothetical protein
LRRFVIRVNADGTCTAAFRYFRDGQRRRVLLGQLALGAACPDVAQRRAAAVDEQARWRWRSES